MPARLMLVARSKGSAGERPRLPGLTARHAQVTRARAWLACAVNYPHVDKDVPAAPRAASRDKVEVGDETRRSYASAVRVRVRQITFDGRSDGAGGLSGRLILGNLSPLGTV
jgi:hypothetical protein